MNDNGIKVARCDQNGTRSGSTPLMSTKQSNMSKIKDNYLAEIIIILVVATMLLTSCGGTKKCCIKTANEVYKHEGMYANQEWDKE